jgi:hypothetical protein
MTAHSLIDYLAKEVAYKVISRHFVYNPHFKTFIGGYYTGKNDHKCVQCNNGMVRRFKYVPQKLVVAIVQRFNEELTLPGMPENARFVNESNAIAFIKGDETYKELEKMGEDAIHTWMDHETFITERRARRTHNIRDYDIFESHPYHPSLAEYLQK